MAAISKLFSQHASSFRSLSRSTITLLAVATLAACASARPAPVATTPARIPARVPILTPDSPPTQPTLVVGVPAKPVSTSLLGDIEYDLPVEANSWVEAEVEFLVSQRRDVVARWMQRGDYYRDFVHQVFGDYGIPTDLYHLGLIESGFVPAARSRSGAVGFWQFMPPTAGDVGLRIGAGIDERMDPVRSTRAAARHLRGLYRSLGDWALAAAAYNAGGGRISRGLVAFSATDFWDLALRGDLTEETRQYVPRLFAMTIIGRDRERFGFPPRPIARPFAFDSIYVEFALPLGEIADLDGAELAELTAMNPHLLSGATPSGGYWLWVPAGKGVHLQRAYLAADFGARFGTQRYTVRWGDTLGELAQDAGVSSTKIREMNPGVDFDRLLAGAVIQMPAPAAARLASASPPGGAPNSAASRSTGDRSVTAATPTRIAASGSDDVRTAPARSPVTAAAPPSTRTSPEVSSSDVSDARAGTPVAEAVTSAGQTSAGRSTASEQSVETLPGVSQSAMNAARAGSLAAATAGSAESRTTAASPLPNRAIPPSPGTSAAASPEASTAGASQASSARPASSSSSSSSARASSSPASSAASSAANRPTSSAPNAASGSSVTSTGASAAPRGAPSSQGTRVPAATAAAQPARSTAASRSAQNAAAPASYRVRDGDSLWDIAADHDVTVEQLQEANSLTGTVILPGQTLKIPAAKNASGGSAKEAASIVYVVRNGDTLWGIARSHGSSIEAIQRANELGQRPIIPGQRLTVPL